MFQAGQGVALDLVDQAGATPGWVRVRHRDGTGGFVRLREIWGVVKITVIGAGAWGTALAIALPARHEIPLWSRDPAQRAALARTRRSAYLDAVPLPAPVTIATDLPGSLARAALALVVTPTAGIREAVRAVRAARADLPIVWACKGFEQRLRATAAPDRRRGSRRGGTLRRAVRPELRARGRARATDRADPRLTR